MKSELTGHSKLDVGYNHILDDSSKNGYVACSFLAVSPMVSHEVVFHDVLCCLMLSHAQSVMVSLSVS